MLALSPDLPLKRKDELRPITLSPGTLASTAISSSDKPSEKYSLFGSPLVLINGMTATLLIGAAMIDFAREKKRNAAPATRRKVNAAAIAPHRFRVCVSRLARTFFGSCELAMLSRQRLKM